VKVSLGQVKGDDWWRHSHEDSKPKEEGDQVLYAFCFPLSSTSSKCSNHQVPPSHALLSLNYF